MKFKFLLICSVLAKAIIEFAVVKCGFNMTIQGMKKQALLCQTVHVFYLFFIIVVELSCWIVFNFHSLFVFRRNQENDLTIC